MQTVIDRKRYDTETATEIANNYFCDGSNRLPGGRGSALYRTANGAYFIHRETIWQGERDRIEPIDKVEAEGYYQDSPYHMIEYADAFPGVTVADA